MLYEDLMLLLIDRKTGRVRSGFSPPENALAGAVLMDLVNSGHVAFEPNGKKLQVVDPTPVNDPVLYEKYLENNYKLPEGEDPRITRVGLLLRRTSLDELPQFWNVLRGDMSLIGPRPVVPDELNEYGDKRRVLLSVKPGMSGAWAVRGRSRVGYPQRAAIELGYVQRWKLKADLSILWRTLPAVVTRRGAH